MSATTRTCPRCAETAAPGQEYCLSCGLRLPGAPAPPAHGSDGRALRLRVLGLGAVALAGAAVAIVTTRDATATIEIVTATGGSVPIEAPADTGTRLAPWPPGTDAWTIVLVSVPKVDGRDEAVAVAEEARRRGLTPAGVIDSSRYPSLRPGYWMAYQGIFGSEAEANGALRKARPIARQARVERVSA